MGKTRIPFGRDVMVAGWGLKRGTSYTYLNLDKPKVLQKTNVTVINYETCTQKMRKFGLFMENKKGTAICTISVTGNDSCSGDSGGPIFEKINGKWTVYGLVSFGKKCGTKVPSVYTNVRFYEN